MKLGQPYRSSAKSKVTVQIALSEPDIDGKILLLEYFSEALDGPRAQTKQQVVELTRNANLKIRYEIFDADTEISLYVPPTTQGLSVGDKYQYIGKPPEYTVFNFVMRKKTAAATTTIPYPFGINLADILNYVSGIVKTKTGIQSYLTATGEPTADFQEQLKNILFGDRSVNADLAYWSVADPKPYKVIFIKQPKPKKTITLKPKKKKATTDGRVIPVDSQILQTNDELFENNFTSRSFDYRVSSLLLDEFRLITIDNKYVEYRSFGSSTRLALVNIRKMHNLGIMSDNFTDSLSFADNQDFYTYQLDTLNFYQVQDVGTYKNLVKGGYMVTFVTLDPEYLTKKNVVLNPAMMYLGAGKFTDVQNGEGKYGVGDEFNIGKSNSIDSANDFTILYSSLIQNPSGNFEVVYLCIDILFLRQASDSYNFTNAASSSRRTFSILENQLDANISSGEFSNFKSHRSSREAIIAEYNLGQSNNTTLNSNATDEFAEYRDLLGDDLDDDFLSVVSGLDWMKINKLRAKDPTALDAIKDLIRQIYVDYLLEKDFSISPVQTTVSNDVQAKVFYQELNTEAQEAISKRLKIAGYDDEEIFNLLYFSTHPDAVFPLKTYDEYNQIFFDIIGSSDLDESLIYTADNAKVWYVVNKGNEPAIGITMTYKRYSSDGDVMLEFSPVYCNFSYSLTRQKGSTFEWGKCKDYPKKYYAAYITYRLALYTLSGDEGLRYLTNTKSTVAKQVLPLKVTPFWLSELRYFNSLGLFPTLAELPNYFAEIIQQPLGNSIYDNNYFDSQYPLLGLENWFYSKSLSSVQDKFSKLKVQTASYSHLLENNAVNLIKQLSEIDVDWGNVNAVYEPFSLQPPTKVKTPVTRAAKKPSIKFEEWKPVTGEMQNLIDKAYGYDSILAFHTYFTINNERCAFLALGIKENFNNSTVIRIAYKDFTRVAESSIDLAFNDNLERTYTESVQKCLDKLKADYNLESANGYMCVLFPTGQDFIQSLISMYKAKTQSTVVVPPPPVPPTPPPTSPVPPAIVKPPKPKVKQATKPAVKPPVTKVQKLSKKYQDLDLDF